MFPISSQVLVLLALFSAAANASPRPHASADAIPHSVQVQTVHEFPPNYFIENLAVRRSGEILVTVSNRPELYQVNPFTGEAVLVATIPDVLAVLGVVELEKDIFYTDAGNVSRSDFTAGRGSFSIYKIDMRNFNPAKPGSAPITQAAFLGDAVFLNGIDALDKSAGLILAADSLEGVVWKVNVHTGKAAIVIDDPSMKPDPQNTAFPAGINGIKVRNHALTFDNYDFGTLGRIPIRPDGTAVGSAEIFATGLTGIDDFQYDARGDVFAAQNIPAGNLGFVKKGAETGTLLAAVVGPTAVQFGRTKTDRKTLYITSTGGVTEVNGKNVTVGGRVSKANVGVEGFYG